MVVALQHAVGEARRRVGAFVVGDIELAADIEDREPLVADVEGLHRLRRNIGLPAHPYDVFRLFSHRTFSLPSRTI